MVTVAPMTATPTVLLRAWPQILDDDNDGIADSVDLYPLAPIGDLLDTDGDGRAR